jgi:hypothetical protein
MQAPPSTLGRAPHGGWAWKGGGAGEICRTLPYTLPRAMAFWPFFFMSRRAMFSEIISVHGSVPLRTWPYVAMAHATQIAMANTTTPAQYQLRAAPSVILNPPSC